MQLADHPLCQGLNQDSLLALDRLLERRSYAAGEYILRNGTEAGSVYLLVSGDVSITVPLPNGHPRRLVTLSAGMTFGERAMMDQAARSADVRANTAVECRVLPVTDLQRLTDSHPRIASVLLRNMLRNALQTVERLTREVAALGG